MVTYEDFRYWYADNTDADYDDLCRKVLELLENVDQTMYNSGFDVGRDVGYSDGWREGVVYGRLNSEDGEL